MGSVGDGDADGADEVAIDELVADEVVADEVTTDEIIADEVVADEVVADEVATDELVAAPELLRATEALDPDVVVVVVVLEESLYSSSLNPAPQYSVLSPAQVNEQSSWLVALTAPSFKTLPQ